MFRCSVCGMEFNTQEDHNKHYKDTHGEKSQKVGNMICPICGYPATSEEDMEAHRKTHEPIT